MLTERGRGVFSGLDERSSEQVAAWLSRLGAGDRGRLVEAMGQIGGLLDFEAAGTAASGANARTAVVLRAPRAGDYGWAVERHGALYATERGFDETFEETSRRSSRTTRARTTPSARRSGSPRRMGRRVGCVACVRRPTDDGVETAQLRILLVDPSARGMGVGRRLVEEWMEFARKAGYARMMLYTVDGLSGGPSDLSGMGFEIVHQEAVEMWGHHLVEQEWRLELG